MATTDTILFYLGNIPLRYWACIIILILGIYVLTNDIREYKESKRKKK